MGFKPDHAVNHVYTGPLKLACPHDIGFFIKAGLDFHNGHNLFTQFSSLNQGVNNGRVATGAVQGLLDSQYLGVVGGLGDELLDAG